MNKKQLNSMVEPLKGILEGEEEVAVEFAAKVYGVVYNSKRRPNLSALRRKG